MNNMGISQPSFAFDGDQNNFVEQVTRGITGPPKGVFPYMPNRTQKNPDWPHLHTMKAAIEYIVRDWNEQLVGPSALCVARELDRMGFEVPDVHRTIASVLGNRRHGFVKLKTRYYPDLMMFDKAEFINEGRKKSWAMYALNQSWADAIDDKHTRLAKWLENDSEAARLMLQQVECNLFYKGLRPYCDRRR